MQKILRRLQPIAAQCQSQNLYGGYVMVPVIEMQPDALIMADPGLIMMVREKWPEQEIHLSVQANTVNFATVKFGKKWACRASYCHANCRLMKSPKSAKNALKWNSKYSCMARCAVGVFWALFAVGLLQSPRPKPRHLHQFLSLGLQVKYTIPKAQTAATCKKFSLI